MSATLRLIDPQTGTREHWVEKPYLNIGSAPSSDVRIDDPAIPALAASLRFRGGEYLLFNQTAGSITLDGDEVLAGKSYPVPAGGRIRFPNGAEIELVITGDPAPTRKPVERPVSTREERPAAADVPAEGEDAAATDGKPAGKKGSNTAVLQVGVIVVCVIGCIAILMMNNAPEATAEPGVDLLTAIVEAGDAPPDPKATAPVTPEMRRLRRALVRQVQSAEFSSRTGDGDAAFAKYSRLKNYIDGLSIPEGTLGRLAGDEAFGKNLKQYVETQIAKLPAR